jgi:tol-pal system protein YbgF
MTRNRLYSKPACTILTATFAVLLGASGTTYAQVRSGNFLDTLFNRGEPQAQREAAPTSRTPQIAQADSADVTLRLDRIENALRKLTGTIEDLQHRNQQLEMRLQRMQVDTEFRFQQLGAKGAGAPMQNPAGTQPRAMPQAAPGGLPPAVTPGRRADVFDPNQHPNAPGAPRMLGTEQVMAPQSANAANESIGAPGGRAAGAPLDLSTLSSNPPQPPAVMPPGAAPATPAPMNGAPVTTRQPPVQSQLPASPRNANAPDTRLATLPPSASPQDEYDMAYGYVLHKDYALAEQAFRDFLQKHPEERLVPDAQYWLGESLFQRQRYRDAAESFLAVSTKYEHAGKAPNALLRLGQSLAAMHQKEAACATLAEVGRKYPRASASVKRGVAQELKRAHC